MKHSLTPEIVPESSITDMQLARRLSDQYAAATASIRTTVQHVLAFGAMLLKTERIVFAEGPARGNRFEKTSNGGLESWLATHCPEINYKTAMRWKGIAAAAVGSLGCDAENGAKLLLGETKGLSPELPVREMQSRVDELYEAGSIRKLSQMCFDFAKDDAADARADRDARPIPKMSKRDEAKAIWNALLVAASKSSVKDAIPLLGEAETHVAYDTVRELAAALKSHLAEF